LNSATTRRQFEFGENWRRFSENALNAARVAQAKQDFAYLLAGIDLDNQSFLDIGFGQGLSLLIATAMGARTVGCEVDPICAEIFRKNKARYFPEIEGSVIPIVIGSILDQGTLERLRRESPDPVEQQYSIVHAWGALHHTGDIRCAILNAASLVKRGGYLVIAIYAHHWSSRGWRMFKRIYNRSPGWIQRMLIILLCPLVYVAKWLVTGRSPLKQMRGMDFYYDLVDWAGGYPYEYATATQIEQLLAPLGFHLERCIPPAVPTGCNEFIFRFKG